ncbi:protein scylla [Drosophila ficusphila]|uniref:protein scylla n=1 Tax=Drosophila ficusphila TaxID=30025 RepID=UPI0007E5C6C6|nr:protein scylla [Drosophila ficusphila]
MKMDVIPVQTLYDGVFGSNKNRDWTSTLTPPVTVEAAVAVMPKKAKTAGGSSSSSIGATATSIKHKQPAGSGSNVGQSQSKKTKPSGSYNSNNYYAADDEEANSSGFYSSDLDMKAVEELSLRLLDELRAAKSRHLTCTEVSLPCDLTPSVAREIIRVSEKEPRGIRGCTIYIEFEDEPKNSRRIASIKVDPDTVSTFEVYLTLRQDHRGWTSLLPQFMKSLARTITISPEYTITKNKLYSADGLGARRSYSFGSHAHRPSAAIATPTN